MEPTMHALLKRWGSLDGELRIYLAVAVGYLLRSRVGHLTHRAGNLIAPALAPAPDAGKSSDRRARIDPVKAIWAVEAAARHVPWRADCLIQAVAASRWLLRHGYAPVLRVGVARSGTGDLLAHAWLELDGDIVLGKTDGAGTQYVPFQSLVPATPSRSA